MFKLFNKNKSNKETKDNKEVNETKENNIDFFKQDNATENMDLFLEELFKCKTLYTFILKKLNDKEKYYTQVVENKLVGFLYTNREIALSYLEEDLKEIKDKGIYLKELNISEIISYIEELKTHNIDGFIINYPNNWVIFEIKN